MSVYNGQGLLKISLETGQDLTDATSPKVLFEKPDRTKGEWTGTVSGTKIEYAVQANDIDQKGIWRFQVKYTISGRDAYGEIDKIEFKQTLNA
jgi:hypothetical protein